MKKTSKSCIGYIVIMLCATLNALSYHIFILKNSFAPSGLNGLATMVQYLFGFEIGYLNLIINIPLLILAYYMLNKELVFRTATYVLTFSAAMLIFDKIDFSCFVYYTSNGTSTVLAPVAAGVISGFVAGTTLKSLGSTGGTDIIASLIRKKKPYLNLVWMIFGLNVLVAVISYFVYGYRIEPVLLSILYSFVLGRVSNVILQGGKEAVKFEVITDRAEEMSEVLITNLRHSVTVMPAIGMYTHEEKSVLLCIVNKHQIVNFQNILKQFPGSFAYISTIRETMGNFKNIL